MIGSFAPVFAGKFRGGRFDCIDELVLLSLGTVVVLQHLVQNLNVPAVLVYLPLVLVLPFG